jgi:hypothetical protein
MVMSILILTPEQKQDLTKDILLDLIIEFDGTSKSGEHDMEIVNQLHRLVAYHSVPGTYKRGIYDF